MTDNGVLLHRHHRIIALICQLFQPEHYRSLKGAEGANWNQYTIIPIFLQHHTSRTANKNRHQEDHIIKQPCYKILFIANLGGHFSKFKEISKSYLLKVGY